MTMCCDEIHPVKGKKQNLKDPVEAETGAVAPSVGGVMEATDDT